MRMTPYTLPPLPTSTLQAWLGCVTALADEAPLYGGPGGLTIRSVDPACVAMGDVRLLAGPELPPRVPDDQKAGAVGLNAAELLDSLVYWTGKETVTLGIGDGTVILSDRSTTRRRGLLDATGMTTPTIPKLTHDAWATFDVAGLERWVRAAAKTTSDHVGLCILDGRLIAWAESDTGRDQYDDPTDAEAGEATGEGRAESLYSCNYLSHILRALKAVAPTATLRLSNDMPLEIAARSSDLSATYLLAPRIEDDGGVLHGAVLRTEAWAAARLGLPPPETTEEAPPTPSPRPIRSEGAHASTPKPDAGVFLVESIGTLDKGDGASWDDLTKSGAEAGLSEEDVEEAMSLLMDQGRVYEPVLGRLKVS